MVVRASAGTSSSYQMDCSVVATSAVAAAKESGC